jgi:hypothetical protein
MIKISIVNNSASFHDVDLQPMCTALQMQVTRDLYPAWGVDARIYWTPSGSHPSLDHWVIGLFDTANQAGALGYHDVTPAGLPIGKVFVETSLANGVTVSSVASHELTEQLIDPGINLVAELDDPSGGASKFYAYEVADACEAESYVITVPANIGGPAAITVSDFVLPSWFEGFRTGGQFDFLNKMTAPFQLLPGGYISVFDLKNLSAGWQQLMAHQQMSPAQRVAARPYPGSRRMRRSLPRSEWVTSTYTPGDTANPVAA